MTDCEWLWPMLALSLSQGVQSPTNVESQLFPPNVIWQVGNCKCVELWYLKVYNYNVVVQAPKGLERPLLHCVYCSLPSRETKDIIESLGKLWRCGSSASSVGFKVAFWHNFPFLTHFWKVNVHHDRYLIISILPTTCLTLLFYTLFDQI